MTAFRVLLIPVTNGTTREFQFAHVFDKWEGYTTAHLAPDQRPEREGGGLRRDTATLHTRAGGGGQGAGARSPGAGTVLVTGSCVRSARPPGGSSAA